MYKIKREILLAKREKIVKFHKIRLIYYSKFKYNVIERKIREKTYNLTQNCDQDDPIHLLIKAFHSTFQKMKIRCSTNSNFQPLLQRKNDSRRGRK